LVYAQTKSLSAQRSHFAAVIQSWSAGVDNDNDVVLKRGRRMRIFIFKSDASPDLRAFGGDLAGGQLPKQLGPWHAVGAVAPDQKPPHELSRNVIEDAIKTQGFQLWRMSKKDAE
jgi:hypothetical protein